MSKKKIILLIVLIIGFICLTPFVLEYFVFRNHIYSALNNSDWSGFLGSYIGGVFGGIGTLLTVYITTRETRKIQYENMLQNEKDKELNEKRERKLFAESLALEISKYITDISKYFYACKDLRHLYENKDDLNRQLRNTEQKISQQLDMLTTVSLEEETTKYLNIDKEVERLKQKEEELKYKIDIIIKEIELNRADRTIANECYFVLKIRLQDIEAGNRILEQLEYIHKNSTNVEGTDYGFIQTETDKLLDMTVRFIDEHINKN